jgi:hypothetical protein
MTTNQTIDGVPRERIQEIISDIERGGRLTALEKLRTLLEVPVKAAIGGYEVPHLNACASCSGRFSELKNSSNALLAKAYYVE